ncbi:hypothetical protein [Helicobacter bizzozeronii]|uniref:hypothetical protein n=1 Tax=Helicobacter bizzozeronii TaxID=56877 RepID=UPI000CF1AB28|nr:hypothetical protein [Helicobacter bizzozeronii]
MTKNTEIHIERGVYAYSACVYQGKVALEVSGVGAGHFVSYKSADGRSKKGFLFRQGTIRWEKQSLDYSQADFWVCFGGKRVRARLKPTNSPQFYALEFGDGLEQWEAKLIGILAGGSLAVRSKVYLFVKGWEVCGGRAVAFILDVRGGGDFWKGLAPQKCGGLAQKR